MRGGEVLVALAMGSDGGPSAVLLKVSRGLSAVTTRPVSTGEVATVLLTCICGQRRRVSAGIVEFLR